MYVKLVGKRYIIHQKCVFEKSGIEVLIEIRFLGVGCVVQVENIYVNMYCQNNQVLINKYD